MPSLRMSPKSILDAMALAAVSVLLAVPVARADHAVLKSGQRLHITGYQVSGDRVLLAVDGGIVSIPAASLVAVEPEDLFPENHAAAPAAGPFRELIRAAAQKHGIEEKLIARVIAVESNFNPRAVSRRRAQGLMQLLPQTAARFSVADVFDPAQNIDAGARYLKELLERYQGDLRLALAAYNAGPEMVDRYGGIPPFAETQNYVRRITARLGPSEESAGAEPAAPVRMPLP